MSYQDYLDGFRDGVNVGFKAGVKKGFELGQTSGYLRGYGDGYKDAYLDLPYKCRNRLNEFKLEIPTIDPLPLLKDKYEPPKLIFDPLPKKYNFEPVIPKYKL